MKRSGLRAGAAQRRGQGVQSHGVHVAKKMEGEVQVFRVDPTHHATGRIQALLDFPDFSGQRGFHRNRNEGPDAVCLGRSHGQAGSCWLMQWNEPRPQIKSVESIPMTRRRGNTLRKMDSASESFGSR